MIAIVLDIDWAPDFVIEAVAEILVEKGVCATWFITHASPVMEQLRRYPDLFELGIHPNFLAGSTHGETPAAVMQHCMQMVPEAVSMRTHSLYQSTPLLKQVAGLTQIENDVSLFMPYAAGLRPVRMWFAGCSLVRIPVYWSDTQEMVRPDSDWRLETLLAREGLKVFAFHPIHVYLNLDEPGPYQALKQELPNLKSARKSDLAAYIRPGRGAGAFLSQLVDHLSTCRAYRILDLSAWWRETEGQNPF